MASDRRLARISLKPALGNDRVSGGRHDVFSLLRVIRQETDAEEIAQILPFADAHASEHGMQNLVEACYRMLLKRPASALALKFWQSPGRSTNPAAEMLAALVASEEFRNDPRCHIPGPFHPEFRLTLSPLR